LFKAMLFCAQGELACARVGFHQGESTHADAVEAHFGIRSLRYVRTGMSGSFTV
jgi:hypothetical protein